MATTREVLDEFLKSVPENEKAEAKNKILYRYQCPKCGYSAHDCSCKVDD
jgi:hypothetical protein